MKNGVATMARSLGPLDQALELRAAGMLPEALAVLAGQSESDFRIRGVRAEIEFALGRFADAALSYFSIAVTEPQDANLQFNLGLSLERCGRWEAAAEAFQRVLRLDANRPEAQLGLGACLLHLNRPEEALKTFDACRFGDARERGRFGRAVALQQLGRFAEAERIYETLLAAGAHAEEALSNLIAMSIERQDLDGLRDHSRRLLDVCPESVVALQGLATVASHAGDDRAAAGFCNRILTLAPDCLEAWHNLRIAMDRSETGFSGSSMAVYSGGSK
jgi:tetratricopeptide (TPR) repeat protein